MAETRGIARAWFLRFAQDVPIFQLMTAGAIVPGARDQEGVKTEGEQSGTKSRHHCVPPRGTVARGANDGAIASRGRFDHSLSSVLGEKVRWGPCRRSVLSCTHSPTRP